jgi:tRNA (mo5U34)-methyltransferase
MFDHSALYRSLEKTCLKTWLDELPKKIETAFADPKFGDMPKWMNAVDRLSTGICSSIDLNASAVRAGVPEDMSVVLRSETELALRDLHPWRKGPYDICGIHIDTEWRSDWKWDRVLSHLSPLKDRLVLDVGCGNGYHCWRMKGAGARLVVGIDPYMIYVMQFLALKKIIGEQDVHVLPLGIEDLPNDESLKFDTVFSMGVLYHRRSPLDHLLELRSYLRDGGELVLETLVVDGGVGMTLLPSERYAKMRNVWFIPTCATLQQWLTRIGFKEIKMVDINQTSIEEQRSTDWMKFESLPDFLDPQDSNLTIEGHPAPKRAVFIAQK